MVATPLPDAPVAGHRDRLLHRPPPLSPSRPSFSRPRHRGLVALHGGDTAPHGDGAPTFSAAHRGRSAHSPSPFFFFDSLRFFASSARTLSRSISMIAAWCTSRSI